MPPALIEEAPTKAWIIHPHENLGMADELAASLGIDQALALLLQRRGIHTFDQSKAFFRPHWNDLHDPFLMKGMQQAVELMQDCIARGQRILLYGDYDVDGTTSVALCYRVMRRYCTGIGYYIPDRQSEGYGLSFKGLDWAVEQGYHCIITLDCGITAVEEVAYANAKGLRVLVTDHHQPAASLPPAYAVLNPLQSDCPYPFKDLSGCGVAFKLLTALCSRLQWPQTELLDHLELVAISIAADMVSLSGENRVLTYYGLQKLNQRPIPGITAMLQHYQARKPKLEINDVVFGISPRINAAGRMGDARLAVRLLAEDEVQNCAAWANEIENSNLLRRDTDSEITLAAIEQATLQHQLKPQYTTVVCGRDWHKGVIGIAASRLVEKFYKPTVIFCEEDGKMTGSARSVQGFDLYYALSQCSETIEQFGGHKYAAGLTLLPQHYPAFIEKFEQVVADTIEPWQLRPSLDIDLELNLNQITPKFFRVLQQFSPFGTGNKSPLFCARHVFAAPGSSRIVGQNHLCLQIQQDDSPRIPAIAFGQGGMLPLLAKGLPLDIAFHLEENYHRGVGTMQTRIVDLRMVQ
ncbi:MAG: single-stranded-DNA-specific exonuclease RecJ [Sphingomonadales bacterium]|nr:single-stranded-DNA-specific exonuclease RecJ [Sphingomonadales bacterium]